MELRTWHENRFLNNRLSIDADVYYIDWSNIQQQIYLPICGFAFTSNVGNAESYGSEVEARYKVTRGLTVGLTGSYNRAVITSSNNPQTAQVGEHVLNTPGWTFTAYGSYDWSVFGDSDAFVRADYDWTGSSRGSFVQQIRIFSIQATVSLTPQ